MSRGRPAVRGLAATRPLDGVGARRVLAAPLALVCVLAFAARADAAVTLPPTPAAFDYQLGGGYTPPAGTQIVTRDRTDSPVPGAYNVCYVNAFQSQPNEKSFWTGKRKKLLLRTKTGKLVQDPEWPGEYMLDTSRASRRAALAKIVGGWIDSCAKKGFQAIEPDNLDSWTRKGASKLSAKGNFAFSKRLIARAHRRGLAIAQKNAAEQSARGKALGFDFAVAESCQAFDECDDYINAYGKNVLEIEYTTDDNGEQNFRTACADHGDRISIIYRDVDLVTPDDDGYVYQRCGG